MVATAGAAVADEPGRLPGAVYVEGVVVDPRVDQLAPVPGAKVDLGVAGHWRVHTGLEVAVHRTVAGANVVADDAVRRRAAVPEDAGAVGAVAVAVVVLHRAVGRPVVDVVPAAVHARRMVVVGLVELPHHVLRGPPPQAHRRAGGHRWGLHAGLVDHVVLDRPLVRHVDGDPVTVGGVHGRVLDGDVPALNGLVLRVISPPGVLVDLHAPDEDPSPHRGVIGGDVVDQHVAEVALSRVDPRALGHVGLDDHSGREHYEPGPLGVHRRVVAAGHMVDNKVSQGDADCGRVMVGGHKNAPHPAVLDLQILHRHV